MVIGIQAAAATHPFHPVAISPPITHFSPPWRGKTIRYNNWQMAEAGKALQMKCNVVTVWK